MCSKSGKEPYWKILGRYVILQLALEFGIVTGLVLLKAPYERRPGTGKRTQVLAYVQVLSFRDLLLVEKARVQDSPYPMWKFRSLS
ncbi:hypothetical protein Tco_0020034, partial [Tanacetum coccineum]